MTVLKALLAGIVPMVVLYLACAFVAMDFDARNWETVGRFCYAALVLINGVPLVGYVLDTPEDR
jgi:hypothetical protein